VERKMPRQDATKIRDPSDRRQEECNRRQSTPRTITKFWRRSEGLTVFQAPRRMGWVFHAPALTALNGVARQLDAVV
jgi:hypothetical protein